MDQLYQSQRVPSTATTSGLGPYPKVEPGVKFRPLAFYDQIELIQKTGKIPGNGTRVAGTQFYIRIPNTAMKKFVQGQVRQNLISPIVRLFSSGMIFRWYPVICIYFVLEKFYFEILMLYFQTPTREKYSFLIRFADMSPVSMGQSVLADEIPTTLRLKVNDREPELPPHIPPSKAGVDPKRQKRPIQITPQVNCHTLWLIIEIMTYNRNYDSLSKLWRIIQYDW